jgi:geranylgeranyl diphosphate synthase type II
VDASGTKLPEFDATEYLDACKGLVLRELERIVPQGALKSILYDRALDYPRRSAKSLRPALCIAASRALGGGLESVLPTASVLELYHNAFLIHDDIEDGSELRRDLPTLHETYGIPVAVNVGDAMLALALGPLLDNIRTVGLGKSLRVLRQVAEMARVTAEGQALELEWIRTGRFDLRDEDYLDMAVRKTSYYSFVTPLLLGATLAGAETALLHQFEALGRPLGLAFQIQDDVLNLTADYGKERDGDLYEGKYTLILLHLLRSSSEEELCAVKAILAKPRRRRARPEHSEAEAARAYLLERAGKLPPDVGAALVRAFSSGEEELEGSWKTADDVTLLKSLIEKYGSIEHARAVAHRLAEEAAARFEDLRTKHLRSGPDAQFLSSIVSYVVERKR